MPTDEPARLAALTRYRILDTEPEQAFDDLTVLASQICGTPIALISLVDDKRQWFKSKVGLSLEQASRQAGFCAQVMAGHDIIVVPNALADDRFRDDPLVTGPPHVRFYAGAPLVTPEGHVVGVLCVIDLVARALTRAQVQALDALRRQVQSQLELRKHLDELKMALIERDRAEAEQAAMVRELRESLDHVTTLSGLLPYCSTCELNMVIPADPAAIPRVSEGVQQLLTSKGWPEEEVEKVELALQESLANAVRHGCKDDPTQQVQCVLTCDASGEIVIVVRDPGPGFDPAAVPHPLEGGNIFKASGRGVFLINQLMDEVTFRDGGREVLMRKAAAKAAATAGPGCR